MYILLIALAVLTLCVKPAYRKLVGYTFVFTLIFIGAFRDITIGTDTSWYYHNWILMTSNPTTWNHFTPFEPGFNWFIIGLKYLCNSYYFFYSCTFIIMCMSLSISSKIFRIPVIFLFIFFLLANYFSLSMNVMRQTFGLSLGSIFVALYYRTKINFVSYCVFVIGLTYLIHNSLIILLAFPLFKVFDWKKILDDKRLYVFLICAQIISITCTLYISDIMLNVFHGALDEKSDKYLDDLDQYGVQDAKVGWISSFILNLLFIFLSRHNRNSLFYYAYLGIIISTILSSFESINRIAMNATLFTTFYYAQNWNHMIKYKWNKYAMVLLIVLYVYILNGALLGNDQFNPYKLMFNL